MRPHHRRKNQRAFQTELDQHEQAQHEQHLYRRIPDFDPDPLAPMTDGDDHEEEVAAFLAGTASHNGTSATIGDIIKEGREQLRQPNRAEWVE